MKPLFIFFISTLLSTIASSETCPNTQFKFGDIVKIQSYTYQHNYDSNFVVGLSGVVVSKRIADEYNKECGLGAGTYDVRVCDIKRTSCHTIMVCLRDLKKVGE